jgi:prevent-host-death family protein
MTISHLPARTNLRSGSGPDGSALPDSRLSERSDAVDFCVTLKSTTEVGCIKFVSSREIRVNPRPVFEAAEEGDEVVITSHGKPVALLVGVNGEDLEETIRLVRRARAQVAVSRMRRAASRKGSDNLSREEIEAEIAVARSERAAR